MYAWISRMAVHLAIERLRKEKKLEVSPLDDHLPEVKAPEPADIDRIPASVLNGFIAELPAVKRVIFNMACVEDLPHKEIAGQLGITEGASRSMLTKAKKTLAGMIRDYMDKNK